MSEVYRWQDILPAYYQSLGRIPPFDRSFTTDTLIHLYGYRYFPCYRYVNSYRYLNGYRCDTGILRIYHMSKKYRHKQKTPTHIGIHRGILQDACLGLRTMNIVSIVYVHRSVFCRLSIGYRQVIDRSNKYRQ